MELLQPKEILLVIFLIIPIFPVNVLTKCNDYDDFGDDDDYYDDYRRAFLLNLFNHRNRNEKLILKLSKLNTPEYITYFGYPVETHEVVTSDKYILQLHRIPFGKNHNAHNGKRTVVYLQHGFIASSFDWFIPGPEKGLGFLLADAGYDVWAGNSRGNLYSRRNLVLNPDKDEAFWDFSWHEIGVYDLPATIDYILNKTKQEKLFYIGHSHGTTVYYVLLSEHPQYNTKIHSQFSLAPAAYAKHISGPGIKFINLFKNMFQQTDYNKVLELNNNAPIFTPFKRACENKSWKNICIGKLFTMTGFNYKQFNDSLLPFIVNKYPAGASSKQFRHTSQLIISGEFEQYDYGARTNMKIYKSYSPPKYKLGNIRAPIYLIYSLNDYLSRPPDVYRLYSQIPDGNKHVMQVPDKEWNHIDFLTGIDAKTLIYDKILKIMETHLLHIILIN